MNSRQYQAIAFLRSLFNVLIFILVGVQDVMVAIDKLGDIFAKKQPLSNKHVCVCVYVRWFVCMHVRVCVLASVIVSLSF